jgi:hypothetical protein
VLEYVVSHHHVERPGGQRFVRKVIGDALTPCEIEDPPPVVIEQMPWIREVVDRFASEPQLLKDCGLVKRACSEVEDSAASRKETANYISDLGVATGSRGKIALKRESAIDRGDCTTRLKTWLPHLAESMSGEATRPWRPWHA